ncbi:LuxR C-terminal-related transcriptional regulator [Streptomyces sp. NPDC020801]|uniref:LuxR C-terminal-related transcriptional regulator n=1 Tax=unclassified Streptomyces TaxID=2593676 RepID=UPI0037BCA5ED
MIPPLLGRDRERADLLRFLDCADDVFVLVRGGFGSGKSLLLADLCEQAHRAGHAVFFAGCTPQDSLSNEPLLANRVGALKQHVRRPRPATALHHALGSGGGRTTAGGSGPEPVPAGTVRTAVVIDDLQWADSASLTALRDVMHTQASTPTMIVASLGPGDCIDERALGGILPLFHHRIQLSSLAPDTVLRHLAELLGEHGQNHSLAAAYCAATGGNHYLLRTLLALVAGHGDSGRLPPHRVLQAVLPDVALAARPVLRRTGPHAERLAAALAALGGVQPGEVIAGATGVDVHVVEDTVHALTQTGFVERAGDRVRLVPPLLVQALARQVSPSQHKEYHGRAAELLLAWGAPSQQVARHLVHAPAGIAQAPETLRRAADTARDRGDLDDAVAYLRRALDEQLDERTRAEVLAQVGAAGLESNVPTAVKELRSSLRLADGPAAQARTARQLAGALFAIDRSAEAREVLEKTIERIHPHDAALALRLEIDHLLVSLTEAVPSRSTRPRLEQLHMGEAAGTSAERPMAALLSFRGALLGQSSPAQVIDWACHGLGRGVAPADDESVVYPCAVLALGAAGRPDLAYEHADATVTEARTRASALLYAQALSTRANAHCRMGRFPDAQSDAERALAEFWELGLDRRQSHNVVAVTTLGESLIRQGKVEEAEALLQDSELFGSLPTHMIYDYPLMLRGWLHAAQGRYDKALSDLLQCGERLAARDIPGLGLYPWRSEAALVHLQLGNHEQALSLAADELHRARSWAVPEMTGVALRAQALVTGGPAGLEMLEEAVRLLTGTPARFRYAQAQADRGMLSVRCGQMAQARSCLQEAVSVAHECGARPIAEQALEQLRALGDRPRTPTFRGQQALTPTQRQVAELAAKGMTNSEIAQHLFVGLRTVEMHLTRAYAKLGTEGRHGLAQALR